MYIQLKLNINCVHHSFSIPHFPPKLILNTFNWTNIRTFHEMEVLDIFYLLELELLELDPVFGLGLGLTVK